MIDEAAKMQTDKALEQVLERGQPIVDKGGRLVMLSTPEKSRPNSMFNGTFEGAVAGKNNWTPLFLPWQCRPGRTQPWYDQELASQTYKPGLTRSGSGLHASRISGDGGGGFSGQDYGQAYSSELAVPVLSAAELHAGCRRHCAGHPRLGGVPGSRHQPVPPEGEVCGCRLPGRRQSYSDDSACHVLRVDNGEDVRQWADWDRI